MFSTFFQSRHFQDHLESFFGRVRCRLGCNTNPTAKQFTAAYKKLVLGACGRNFSLSGNIIGQDETYSLDVFKTKTSGIQYIERELELEEVQDELQDELESFDTNLSEFQNSAILYIAGFVKRKMQTTLKCQPCLETVNSKPTSFQGKSLIDLKDRGGLMYPSADLVKVCQVTESKIQVFKSDQTLFNRSNILQRICLKSTSTMLTQFPKVLKSSDHQNLHKYNLLNQISLIYSTLRLKHLAREKNREEKPTKLRKKLSKLILFAHQ